MKLAILTTKEARKLFGFLPDKYLQPLWIAEHTGKTQFLVDAHELQEIRSQWRKYYYNNI